jgi:cell division protein FtsB
MKSRWGQSGKYLRVRKIPIDISPKVARIILLSIVTLVMYIFMFGDVGLLRIWKAQTELKTLSGRIAALEIDNERLGVQIERLRSDPFAIEKVAREKYGYLRPGERVYRIILLGNRQKNSSFLSPSLDIFTGSP